MKSKILLACGIFFCCFACILFISKQNNKIAIEKKGFSIAKSTRKEISNKFVYIEIEMNDGEKVSGKVEKCELNSESQRIHVTSEKEVFSVPRSSIKIIWQRK